MTRPVTQVAEVAVNKAVRNPWDFPVREEIGRHKIIVPSRIIPMKVMAMIRLMLMDRRDFRGFPRGLNGPFFSNAYETLDYRKSIHPNRGEGKNA